MVETSRERQVRPPVHRGELQGQECLQAAGDQQVVPGPEEGGHGGGVWSCSWRLDSGGRQQGGRGGAGRLLRPPRHGGRPGRRDSVRERLHQAGDVERDRGHCGGEEHRPGPQVRSSLLSILR